MEKLVDIVHFLHLEINKAFGSAGKYSVYILVKLLVDSIRNESCISLHNCNTAAMDSCR